MHWIRSTLRRVLLSAALFLAVACAHQQGPPRPAVDEPFDALMVLHPFAETLGASVSLAPAETAEPLRRSSDEAAYLITLRGTSVLLLATARCASPAEASSEFVWRSWGCSVLGSAINPTTRELIAPISLHAQILALSASQAAQQAIEKMKVDDKTSAAIGHALRVQ